MTVKPRSRNINRSNSKFKPIIDSAVRNKKFISILAVVLVVIAVTITTAVLFSGQKTESDVPADFVELKEPASALAMKLPPGAETSSSIDSGKPGWQVSRTKTTDTSTPDNLRIYYKESSSRGLRADTVAYLEILSGENKDKLSSKSFYDRYKKAELNSKNTVLDFGNATKGKIGNGTSYTVPSKNGGVEHLIATQKRIYVIKDKRPANNADLDKNMDLILISIVFD